MEVLAQTEYQDLYRIKPGILLVVNKFKPIVYDSSVSCSRIGTKVKSYDKGCQKQLQVLKNDYTDYDGTVVPKGTVLYYYVPVEPVDRSKWSYQIKTTGDSFNGDYDTILKMLEEIKEIIKEEE